MAGDLDDAYWQRTRIFFREHEHDERDGVPTGWRYHHRFLSAPLLGGKLLQIG